MTTLTAVDVGYNTVKFMATNGREGFFPSEVGTGYRQLYGIRESESTMVLEVDGTTWAIGETALRQSAYTSGRRDSEWVLSPSWYALFCAALSEVHKGTVKTNLVTGLPLEDYSRLAVPLRERLTGQHQFKRGKGRLQTVTIENALVITQPYGSLLDQALADNGRILENAYTTGMVAIADLGGNTLNLLVADSLEEIGQWTQGDGLGLLKALDAIARDIHETYPNITPKAREVSQWIAQGYFEVGERIDIAPFARPHLKPLADMAVNRFTEVWREPGRYRVVLLTGGGALALGDMLKTEMNGVYNRVVVVPNPVFGNVRGYLKLARRLWE